MGDHSIIPPSSASRRVQCRASAVMEAMHPSPETDDSREGTAAHELAEQMIVAFTRGGHELPTRDQAIGKQASNGVVFTDEMYDAALIYAEHCRDVMDSTRVYGGPNLRVEQRVHAERIHPECWGTPDFSLFDGANRTLYLSDFKFGHRAVEVFENWQLIEYATGLLDWATAGNGFAGDDDLTVVFTIVQPRSFHRDGIVRNWTVKASDLRAHVNILATVEHEALGPDPRTTTGAECRDCSARHVCDTLQQAGSAAVAYIGSPLAVQVQGAALGLEIDLLRNAVETAKARLTGLEAQAEATIKGGGEVPGWSLEPGKGRAQWVIPPEQVIQFGDLMGVNLRKPIEPCTPNQAISRGLDKDLIKEFKEIPNTAAKLIKSNQTKAARVFGKPRG